MTQQQEEPKPADPKAAKKPYVAPKLVHLGSVRDLTANGGVSGDDLPPGAMGMN